ncbi:MAG: nuclear transport factor 2 family protein [Novosphingobium sp.]|nr:nuclear transport factor 2 family protein [Novosphingobium sp.]
MSEGVDFLIAQAGVIQLHARYTDAIWRQDIEAFTDCFTEDAEWRIGGRTMIGRDAIVGQMSAVFPKFRRILMTMRAPYVEVTPEGASTRTYVTENNVFADGTPVTAIGTYFDRVVDGGQGWRFRWRLFQTSYLGPADFTGTFFEGNPDFGAAPAMPPLDAETIDHTGMHTGRDADAETRTAKGDS